MNLFIIILTSISIICAPFAVLYYQSLKLDRQIAQEIKEIYEIHKKIIDVIQEIKELKKELENQ
jgi:cell division protein FtsB